MFLGLHVGGDRRVLEFCSHQSHSIPLCSEQSAVQQEDHLLDKKCAILAIKDK